MIRSLLYISCALVAVSTYGQRYSGDTWAKVKSKGGELTLVYYEQSGLIYKDASTGKMQGVCAEIIEDFAIFVKTHYHTNLRINYVGEERSFANLLKVVQASKSIMGVSNVSITDDRKKLFKYTPPYIINPLVILTNKKTVSISSLDEIATRWPGYNALIVRGSTYVQLIEKIKKQYVPDLEVIYSDSGEDVLKQIEKNPRQFTILDFTQYVDAAMRKIAIKRHSVNLGTPEEVAFIMPKDSDWDEPWKEFLTLEYKNGLRYRQIIEQNLGPNFLAILK